ncbi:hypothetical protein PRZ48_014463 [Zasmidium cellare]|uniref:Uncharacterized protein n=1 Tax=Zasmidium cellare TaxID=395010 RepID=A0ABR0DYE8_ZASCE|nr:hypothetical protein PRZ48_014463 [Zasmidium cellare]
MPSKAHGITATKAPRDEAGASIEAERQPLLDTHAPTKSQTRFWAKFKAALQDDEEAFQIMNAVFYRSPTGNYLIPSSICHVYGLCGAYPNQTWGDWLYDNLQLRYG